MVKSLSLFLIAGLTLYFGRGWIENLNKPCVKPIPYYLGEFDKRFDLSQAQFLSALAKAEKMWESALTQDLFVYEQNKGKLSVNLIYDYRQEVTEELSVIERTVKTGEKTYDTLESKYVSLKSQYNELKRSYDAAVSIFNQKSDLYESHVENWNRGSRTSKEEHDALEAERQALEKGLSQVRAMESRLNGLVKEINNSVEELNALAKRLNLNVEEYNTVGASRGETFAGGTYTEDQEGRRIDIYEFENEDKLVRVLAHELGHALGLDHVDDPQAIMYYLNEGTNEKLTQADIGALKLLCGVE
jgi:archaellum component FlaC